MIESTGQRIKMLRKRLKLTQDQLAEAVGANRVTIANYEAEKYKPSSEALLKIAETLNVTTDYLLGAEQNELPVISDDDIKFALFGVDPANITDAQFEEVKRFAQFVREQKMKQNGR